jgi:hypothetical protein
MFFGARLDVHTMLGAAAMVLAGIQAVWFAVFAKIFGVTTGLLPQDHRLQRVFDWVTLETGLVISLLLGLAGLGTIGAVWLDWQRSAYQFLDYSVTMRWMIPGSLLLALSVQGFFSSFFLSLLGLKRR